MEQLLKMGLEWLPISQAARELGISERQARRYAARLSPDDRQEPDTLPHPTGEASGDSPAPKGPKRPALVRLSAMRELKDTSKPESPSVNQEPDTQPDTAQTKAGQTPDEQTASAGLATGTTPDIEPDTKPSISIEEMLLEQRERDRKEIDFLRGLVEQRDRDAAELRAALREALRAMPRQLPEATTGTTPDTAPSEANQTGQGPDGAPVATVESAGEAQKAERRPFWKFWGNK